MKWSQLKLNGSLYKTEEMDKMVFGLMFHLTWVKLVLAFNNRYWKESCIATCNIAQTGSAHVLWPTTCTL